MKTLVLICTFFMWRSATGQAPFQKCYSGLANASLSGIATFDDSTFITGPFPCIKMDGMGNVLWSKNIVLADSVHNFPVFFKNFDQNILVGYRTYSEDNVVLKMDTSGNILWSKKYKKNTANYYAPEIKLVRESADKGLFLMENGTDTTGKNYFSTIVKTNSLGDPLWCKSYSLDPQFISPRGQDLIETDDGGFLLSGNYMPTLSTIGNPFIIKLDSAGNVVRAFVDLKGKSRMDKFFKLAKNLFVLIGDGSFRCCDSTANLLWTKFIDYSYFRGGVVKNNHLFCLGTELDQSVMDAFSSPMEIDSMGNVLQNFKYETPDFLSVYLIDVLANGDFISIGGKSNCDLYVIRSDGNDRSGCNEYPIVSSLDSMVQDTLISISVNQYKDTINSYNNNVTLSTVNLTQTTACSTNTTNPSSLMSVSLSPNPFHTTCSIVIADSQYPNYNLNIFNSMGQLVKDISFNNASILIDRKDLTDGIYFYKLQNNNYGLIASGKLLIN